jgi:hypothetical protein
VGYAGAFDGAGMPVDGRGATRNLTIGYLLLAYQSDHTAVAQEHDLIEAHILARELESHILRSSDDA